MRAALGDGDGDGLVEELVDLDDGEAGAEKDRIFKGLT
jgi:hypothetical protein